MAGCITRYDRNGRRFYEFQVRRGGELPRLTKRWYPPENWSEKAIERERLKQLAEFERQVMAGEIISRAEKKEQRQKLALIPTLKEYGESVFMPAKTITMSENSRYSYQGALDNWIYPALGKMKISDVTQRDISALLLSMQKKRKAQATCVKVYTVLKGIFKMAYISDVISQNPMEKVERPKPRKDEIKQTEPESFTVDEMRKILSCLAGEPLKWQVYLRLIIDTGLRRGELCALRWKDVDFDQNTISVAGNLCYNAQAGTYLDTPKSRQLRTVDVDPEIMTMLKALKAEQKRICPSIWVFTQGGHAGNPKKPMHPQTPGRYMSKFAAKYGINHLHPHKLRHSFASIAITNGADIASISEKLGHADKSTTLRLYTHASQESMRRASQVFRDVLKDDGTEVCAPK